MFNVFSIKLEYQNLDTAKTISNNVKMAMRELVKQVVYPVKEDVTTLAEYKNLNEGQFLIEEFTLVFKFVIKKGLKQ